MTLIKRSLPKFPEVTDFFDDDWFNVKLGNGDWSPAVNVVDNKDNYEIEVAAPGLKKEDFKVDIENGILTISGKTEKEEEEKKKNYTRKEFSSKSFSKSFTLPEDVKDEDVKARYKEGVLHLTLQKTAKAAEKKKEVLID